MKRLVFLVEEASMKAALDEIIPRLLAQENLQEQFYHQVIPHKGKTPTLNLFAQGKPTEWRNRLILGDKKYVLPALLPEFAGKVHLIYIDPPFDTGADFSSRYNGFWGGAV